MLRAFTEHQRADGLIAESIDGRTGQTEDHGFNINDNTPLFVMAVGHHARVTGHQDCLQALYEPAQRAGEAILRARDERGLVCCTADGIGITGICGWRNILQNEQITGVVTEINAESYAALRALADLAALRGDQANARHFQEEAIRLREAINRHLINPTNGLYVRNIDLAGHVFTQATIDLVFPLICGVAEPETAQAVTARLGMPDFMTAGGIRSLPEQNPRYDPSFEYGLRGGVWPGATWWYAMSSARTNPETMVESLRRSYWHYVADPKVYNTVPGQFSEWSDGQTLVNRGMRLSPWEAPRFLWAVIEGLVGLKIDRDTVALEPRLPPNWPWLRLHNLPYCSRTLSFFLARQHDGLHVYTCDAFAGDLVQHCYEEELSQGVEMITTGISITAFQRAHEVLVCLGNSLDTPVLGPFLAHHALDVGKRYQVARLTVVETHWQDLGTIKGSDVQRVTTRLEPRGYALYRFRRAT
jgi:glycogen debranching enzyme